MPARRSDGPARTAAPLVIYSLSDPDTLAVRYVGQTNAPRTRWIKHLSNAKAAAKGHRPQSHVGRWVLDLAAKGARPVLTILEGVESHAQAAARESHWIERLSGEGAALLNRDGQVARGAEPQMCSRCRHPGHNRRRCPAARAPR